MCIMFFFLLFLVPLELIPSVYCNGDYIREGGIYISYAVHVRLNRIEFPRLYGTCNNIKTCLM